MAGYVIVDDFRSLGSWIRLYRNPRLDRIREERRGVRVSHSNGSQDRNGSQAVEEWILDQATLITFRRPDELTSSGTGGRPVGIFCQSCLRRQESFTDRAPIATTQARTNRIFVIAANYRTVDRH
jgi:hypothetical protein